MTRDGASRSAGNIVPLPFSRQRYLIVQIRTDCAALRQQVAIVAKCLTDLNGLLEHVEERSVREGFRLKVAQLSELLSHRLHELYAADRALEDLRAYT
ncbi:hypothetical protein [Bradyrhizobium sp. WSM2793]|uniref:hypothetical protein n=1 Tax=Bradyrhizobium sp. WSM2793 TaxID=1038866 RepID=UPI000365B442|nr:hypothetical protein [Bradyrhizobium sp. WSM2793]